jgi:hypothetical protein
MKEASMRSPLFPHPSILSLSNPVELAAPTPFPFESLLTLLGLTALLPLVSSPPPPPPPLPPARSILALELVIVVSPGGGIIDGVAGNGAMFTFVVGGFGGRPATPGALEDVEDRRSEEGLLLKDMGLSAGAGREEDRRE